MKKQPTIVTTRVDPAAVARLAALFARARARRAAEQSAKQPAA